MTPPLMRSILGEIPTFRTRRFLANVHIPNKKWRKLDPKSEKMILVSYSLEQKGYKCFNTCQSRISRDEVASWYGPTSVIPIVFETSGSDANFESEDEERLMAIMGREPTQSLPSLQLTGPEVLSSNQSVTWHEETSNMVSPLCYTHKKKKKGQDARSRGQEHGLG